MKTVLAGVLLVAVLMVLSGIQGCGKSSPGTGESPAQAAIEGGVMNGNLEIPKADGKITDDIVAFLHAYDLFIGEKYPLPALSGDEEHPPSEADVAKYTEVLEKHVVEGKRARQYFGMDDKQETAHLEAIQADSMDRRMAFKGKMAEYLAGLSSGRIEFK